MSDKFEEFFLFVIFRRLSGPDYFLEPRPDLYCLQITSLRMNDRMTFFLVEKSGFPYKCSSFLQQKIDFCVCACVMKCSDLLSAVPLSVSLSLRFLFSFISQKAPPPPPPLQRAAVNLFYLLCVCVCVVCDRNNLGESQEL